MDQDELSLKRSLERSLDELERAKEMAIKYDADLDQLRGKKIRVLRAVVFEGEATAVFAQLSRSLPRGTRTVGQGRVALQITVVDDGTFKIVEE